MFILDTTRGVLLASGSPAGLSGSGTRTDGAQGAPPIAQLKVFHKVTRGLPGTRCLHSGRTAA